MKTEVQVSAELAQVSELIADIPVAMLTQIDAAGVLVSKPMSPLEMDANGALWFFTDQRSVEGESLQATNLSFTDPDRATYVSLSGRSEIHNDRAQIERLWTPFAKPWFPDGPDSPNLVLLKFVPDTAEYWDTPHSKMVRMFAMGASIVAGKPIGLGEHDTLSGLSKKSPEVTSKKLEHLG